MKQHWHQDEESFFGIGVYQPKTAHNIGTLWRTAYILGASFIFIIDGKYNHQGSDTAKAWSKIPFFKYDDFDHFYNSMPHSTQLVDIETGETSLPLNKFTHPPRASYLLGAENNGLPEKIIQRCHHLTRLPGKTSMNVAVSGSIVIYDRVAKRESF
ncbi:RNA methyltransferase [Putridiphycobacter roseus]|nr:RNA methyltransferase [Putridiphycobacter roseus]